MNLTEIAAAWNAQADALNKWEKLGLDEQIEFAQSLERERCIATLLALRDKSGVNADGGSWLMRTARGDCIEALRALTPNV